MQPPREYFFAVQGEPVSKPRMTRADVWKKRPCVLEYRNWADCVRVAAQEAGLIEMAMNDGDVVECILTFILPIPESTKGAKREKLKGRGHNVRPDLDNLVKGVLDALFENDSSVYKIAAEKFYVQNGEKPHCVVILRYESLLFSPSASGTEV